jgi:hypothetical protein
MTFDPNEKRDRDGKWTTGGASPDAEGDAFDRALARVKHEDEMADEAGAAAYVKRIEDAAKRVAADLDYDPTLITVRTDEQKFILNGMQHDYAGAAYLDGSGRIELFAKAIAEPSTIPDITAHEIGHQKFQRFIADYQTERQRMNEDGVFFKAAEVFDKGGMLKGEYVKRYPTYNEYSRAMAPSVTEVFAKSDGITEYSREWWKSWNDGVAKTNQAMHETIAEMTARAYTAPASFETESPKFKAAGFALDTVQGTFKRPSTYAVRVWKGDAIDESTLPPELKASLDRLRARANYEARFLSGRPTSKYSEPAPEWVALYDAIQTHWKNREKAA